MKTVASEPAFVMEENPRHPDFTFGLTKREYFASQALVGFSMQTEYTNVNDIAETCVQIADALIEALNKPEAK